jgi:putative nucleotidyltransferase with HDIG domain
MLVLALRVARASNEELRTSVLTGGFVTLGVAVLAIAVLDRHQPLRAGSVLLLALAASLVELAGTRLNARLEVSAGSVLIVLAAVVLGPLAAVMVGLGAATAELRSSRAKWLTYSGLFAVEGFAAGIAASIHPGSGAVADLAARTVYASLSAFAVNLVGTLVIGAVRRVGALRGHARMIALTDGMGAIMAIPVVVALAYAFKEAGLPVLMLTLVPGLIAYLLLHLYREKLALADALTEGNMTFALSLVRALDARDAHTAGHSAAVAVYARDIATAKALPASEIAKIQLAALLHDIGKIGVPTEVLLKEGALDDDEWEAIRQHPQIGADIAGEAPVFAEIARFIRHHHERPDGRGYPDGLTGDRIPLASAIIGVADAYNAMTSCRPYRKAMAPQAAIEQLHRGAGTQFDPHLVDVFVAVLMQRDAAYRLGQGDRFSLDGQRTAILGELGERRALVVARPAVAAA